MKLAQLLAGLVAACLSLAATATPTHSLRVKFVDAPVDNTTASPPSDSKQAVNTSQPSDASPQTAAPSEAQVLAAPVTVAEPTRTWRVDPALDRNVRLALARWAVDADWTFGPELWELPHDLPVTAPATLATTDDFTEAAQALAEAVALSDTPFRLCFYPNKVLRALPYNAVCDRSQAAVQR